MKAEADSAEQRAGYDAFINAVKTGKSGKLSEWFQAHPGWQAAFPAISFLSGDMFRLANMADESGLLDILKIAVGARVLRGKGSTPGQPGSGAKYPTMYGPNNKPIMYN